MISWQQPPYRVAALGGWVGAAFLVGIGLHSMYPNSAVSMTALSFIVIFCVVFLATSWRSPWLRVAGLCMLALVFGLWRFDVGRASMPRGLQPFSTQGLAHVAESRAVSDRSDPRYWLYRGRRWLTEQAQKVFPADEGALLTGILYGERGLSKTLNDEFRRAGLLHIIAVSGSNVTIVVVMLMRILLGLRLSRRRVFFAITLGLIVFVLFVGPSASVIRAAVMGWLIELAPLVGRIPRPSRLLLLSAVVFTLWRPWALLYDVSFALSFLSMWGLLTWGVFAREKLERVIPWKTMNEILSATIGATVMTIPYSMWAFGQLTLWGALTSLLVLPLVPWIMATGLAALLLPFIPPLTWAADGFLKLVIWIAHVPSRIPFGAWNVSLPFSVMLGVYLFLWILWREFQRGDVIHRFLKKKTESSSSAATLSVSADE